MEKEEVMKMVCSLQQRIYNCGGIVWAESTLAGLAVVVVDFWTDWAMDESWRGSKVLAQPAKFLGQVAKC
jgi:hypothetical protein